MKKLIARGSALALVAAVLIPASATAAVVTPDLIAPTPGKTQINIIGFNDFHGRLLDAERFGATVVHAQQEFGEANSLVLSHGDAVSASIFESAIQRDAPTIDALNALGVDSFTVGNHEFDHGAADAVGRIQKATAGPDLAANVTAADGSHPFDEYALFTVAGVRVAVVGAVTSTTPSLSAAGAVANYSFTDPVRAVNAVTKRLTDGRSSNGEADVVIASYHEGAPASGVSLAENERSEIFQRMVRETDARVAAIFTAHTHQVYAYDAPNAGGTRPVVQAGSYGAFIGQVVLDVDADGVVTAASSSVIPTFTADAIPADIAADPRIGKIRAIVADAVAESDVLGNEKVGLQAGDITRAKIFSDITVDPRSGITSGTIEVPEDRANAGNLSDMIAQSMVDVVNARGNVHADLGLMNPGGVRADLLDDDGLITYKEAATVVPFANDVVVATLSVDVLAAVLDQQWQTTADGSPPSRPYLQLGLSDAFTYSFDSTRAAGQRITSMALDGTPLVSGDTVNVAMSSFLAGGGDNLRALLDAEAVTATGLIDTDAFPSWFRMVSGDTATPVAGDSRRNGFDVRGLPAQLTCTADTEITVSGFDMAHVGYVQNSSVRVEYVPVTAEGALAPLPVGTGAVDPAAPNTATVSVAVPAEVAALDAADLARGLLRITAEPSGSVVSIPAPLECSGVGVTPPDEQTSPAPADDATPDASAPGGRLADSGADGGAALVFGLAAGALVLVGLVFFVISRRRGREPRE